jgi:hypothetical protein
MRVVVASFVERARTGSINPRRSKSSASSESLGESQPTTGHSIPSGWRGRATTSNIRCARDRCSFRDAISSAPAGVLR